MISSGSFADFLNALREFESGVSEARIAQNRGEIIQQVGQDRFDAFEAGELTLTDLQYSSENFLGFVGYQFGEPILIDLEYYEFDATPGTNDFTGTFTGKNGVNSLDDLKTNIQEQIILDEFQLNLDRIETGLGNAGQSLGDFIGRTVTVTDTDGTQAQVELSLTGILASAHLRGAFGTLDFLLNSVASADEIGTSNVQFIEQFGGFDAPSIAELRAGTVEPLVTDATLTVDQPFEGRDGGAPVVVVDPAPTPDPIPVDPIADPVVVTPDPIAQPDPDPQPDPGSQPVPSVDGVGVPQAPTGAPAAVSPVFLRTFDAANTSFTVTGTDGADSSAYGFIGDDIIRTFGGNDSSVGFQGDDFQDLGDGDDRGWGLEGDDILLGGSGNDVLNGDEGDAFGSGIASGSDVLVGGRGDDVLRGDTRDTNQAADRFVFAPGDGNDVIRDFQVGLDVLDFTEFGNNPDVTVSQQGAGTLLAVGDVTVLLEGVSSGQLSASNFLGATFDGAVAQAPDPEPDPVDPEPDPVDPESGPVDPTPDPADPQPDPVDVIPEPDPDPAQAPNASDTGIPDAPDGTPAEVSPVFLRTFDAANTSFTVTGTDGADSSAYGFIGDDIIRTFGGNDSSVGFEGNDFQDLGSGDDRGWGLEGDDILLGGEGNDVLNGDEGDAFGSGVASGSDVLVGGRGDDVLRGDTRDTNQAADRFVFAAGDGNDVIKDFQVGLDVLDFTEFGDDSPVTLSEQGGNAVVGVGDVTVTLEGVGADALSAGDFLGVGFNFDAFSTTVSASARDVAGDVGTTASRGQDAGSGALPDVNEIDALSSLVPEDGLAI